MGKFQAPSLVVSASSELMIPKRIQRLSQDDEYLLQIMYNDIVEEFFMLLHVRPVYPSRPRPSKY